jgi:hypothetical protein
MGACAAPFEKAQRPTTVAHGSRRRRSRLLDNYRLPTHLVIVDCVCPCDYLRVARAWRPRRWRRVAKTWWYSFSASSTTWSSATTFLCSFVRSNVNSRAFQELPDFRRWPRCWIRRSGRPASNRLPHSALIEEGRCGRAVRADRWRTDGAANARASVSDKTRRVFCCLASAF